MGLVLRLKRDAAERVERQLKEGVTQPVESETMLCAAAPADCIIFATYDSISDRDSVHARFSDLAEMALKFPNPVRTFGCRVP